MAPTKRIAHRADPNILHELMAIRNSLQITQQSISRLEHRFKNAESTSTPKINPTRQKINEVANRPVKIDICWFHRMFGAAANPANCPGQPTCKFVPPPIPVPRTKKMIRPPAAVIPESNVSTQPTADMDWAQQMEDDLNNKIQEEELEIKLLNDTE